MSIKIGALQPISIAYNFTLKPILIRSMAKWVYLCHLYYSDPFAHSVYMAQSAWRQSQFVLIFCDIYTILSMTNGLSDVATISGGLFQWLPPASQYISTPGYIVWPMNIPLSSKHYQDSDSDSEFIYSATYHTIAVFNYFMFQTNGPRRPPLRQNNVAGMGTTWMRYLYVHVYIIFYICMYIYIISLHV